MAEIQATEGDQTARVWSRLAPAPDDLQAFKGASGVLYRLVDVVAGTRFYGRPHAQFDRLLISYLREIDGPLTEVTE